MKLHDERLYFFALLKLPCLLNDIHYFKNICCAPVRLKVFQLTVLKVRLTVSSICCKNRLHVPGRNANISDTTESHQLVLILLTQGNKFWLVNLDIFLHDYFHTAIIKMTVCQATYQFFYFIGGEIKPIHLQLLRLCTLGFSKVPCKKKLKTVFSKKTRKKRLDKLNKHRSQPAVPMMQELQ